MVVKMQPNGALEWVKLFPEAGTNNVEDLVATDDGGVMGIGYTSGFG